MIARFLYFLSVLTSIKNLDARLPSYRPTSSPLIDIEQIQRVEMYPSANYDARRHLYYISNNQTFIEKQNNAPQHVANAETLINTQECVLSAPDRRSCIQDPTQWPWIVSGRLEMLFAKKDNQEEALYLGSGILVGPRHVLTAAHNVLDYENNLTTQAVNFFPGQSSYGRPWSSQAISVALPKAYVEARTQEERKKHDIALITLHKALGDTLGFFGIDACDTVPESTSTVTLSGYPGNFDQHMNLYTMAGDIIGYDPVAGRLFYDIDTSPGQSGSGVATLLPASCETHTQEEGIPKNTLAKRRASFQKAVESNKKVVFLFPKALRHLYGTQDMSLHPGILKDGVDHATDMENKEWVCIAAHSHGNTQDKKCLEGHFNSGTAITEEMLSWMENYIYPDMQQDHNIQNTDNNPAHSQNMPWCVYTLRCTDSD